jgi:thiamine-phosphate pyrophosphorylase
MDRKLLDWARAVKSRRRSRVPPLWLFTDQHRGGDPVAGARHLPRGLAGIVLRHDSVADREALGRTLARVCRARRLRLVVAADARLAAALGAGLHLRDGRRTAAPRRHLRRGVLLTSSAHNLPSLRRAARAGVDLAFLSPVLPTASHPTARPLGFAGWSRIARTVALPVAVLGGIDGARLRGGAGRLPDAVGAIGALSP